MAASDPLVRSVLQMLVYSLRMVHDVYTPKSRHVSDSVSEMKEQVAAIASYLESPSAPAALRVEGANVAARLKTVTEDLLALIARHPQLDPRTPAVPIASELPAPDAPA
jgi:hypothetical protein